MYDSTRIELNVTCNYSLLYQHLAIKLDRVATVVNFLCILPLLLTIDLDGSERARIRAQVGAKISSIMSSPLSSWMDSFEHCGRVGVLKEHRITGHC
jgi:hypothetical protein